MSQDKHFWIIVTAESYNWCIQCASRSAGKDAAVLGLLCVWPLDFFISILLGFCELIVYFLGGENLGNLVIQLFFYHVGNS